MSIVRSSLQRPFWPGNDALVAKSHGCEEYGNVNGNVVVCSLFIGSSPCAYTTEICPSATADMTSPSNPCKYTFKTPGKTQHLLLAWICQQGLVSSSAEICAHQRFLHFLRCTRSLLRCFFDGVYMARHTSNCKAHEADGSRQPQFAEPLPLSCLPICHVLLVEALISGAEPEQGPPSCHSCHACHLHWPASVC